MKKLIIIQLISCLSVASLIGQQDAEYSMYMFNGQYINPAYAGSKGYLSTVGIYRHQWAGVAGAPRTFNLSANTPLRNERYNLGLTISNDRLGLTNMFSVTPSFAYRFSVSKKMKLAFGVQAQLMHYSQRLTNGISVDPTLFDDVLAVDKSLFLPNVGGGVYLHGNKFYAGFSVPHLIPYKLDKGLGVDVSNSVSRQYNHYLFTVGGVLGKETSAILWKPSILIKLVKGMPNGIPDFDYNLSALVRQRLWLGASLRTGGNAFSKDESKEIKYGAESISAIAELMITQQLRIGYAYEATLSQLRHYNKGTHEIMLGYDFYKSNKRFVTPRYVTYF